jgi:hypothetical protein
MVPDADLQLQVVIKALGETIAPAVNPANQVAVEQLHLSLGTLKMLRAQLPMTRRFLRALLGDAIALAERLGESVDAAGRESLQAGVAAARAILADPAVENEEIESARSELTDRTVKLLSAADDATRSRLDPVVLEMSKHAIERSRAWFAGSGFEPVSAEIRPISELIS